MYLSKMGRIFLAAFFGFTAFKYLFKSLLHFGMGIF